MMIELDEFAAHDALIKVIVCGGQKFLLTMVGLGALSLIDLV